MTLDREDGEVTLEDCERVSRQLSVRLDVEDLVPNPYDIEVSSPGVERPLRGPRDYLRFAGKRARILMGPGGDDAGQVFEGELAGCDGETVILKPDGRDALGISLGRIKSANLVFQF